MKAILEFNLPEDREDFDLAQNGNRYSCVIEELDNFLRAKIKYEDLPEDKEAIYREIREKLHEIKSDILT